MGRIKGGLENLLGDGKQLIIEWLRLEKTFKKIIEPNHDKDFFFFFPNALLITLIITLITDLG